MVDAALKESSWRFDAVYATSGRPSIPPEKLLRALLLQMLYTVRSERLLMEQLDYNFLFRWFVGLNILAIVKRSIGRSRRLGRGRYSQLRESSPSRKIRFLSEPLYCNEFSDYAICFNLLKVLRSLWATEEMRTPQPDSERSYGAESNQRSLAD
jgi:Transposase domain (DUF772)